MNKRIIIIAAVAVFLLILGIGGYLLFGKDLKSKLEDLESLSHVMDKVNQSFVKGVLPSIGTNPLEDKPDINPVDKINPYTNIKTNPFE